VSGQSGSGKTFLVNVLKELDVEPTTRLMPRARRADDVQQDKAWALALRPDEKQNAIDPYGPHGIFFCDYKYQGYYGFPSQDLIHSLRSHQGASLIIGRCVEIPAAIDGCQSIFPLAPIVNIRLDVPLEIIARRLVGRTQA